VKEFIEVPATKHSKSNRRLVCGVGVNDADYNVSVQAEGKTVHCPYYRKWRQMLRRCYSGEQSAYNDCYVCPEWLLFSNFKKWMELRDWNGNELDKDLLVYGNKVYSPDTCLFISAKINTSINESKSRRGRCMLGVSWCSKRGKYQSHCGVNGVSIGLGYFDSELEAHARYMRYKSSVLISMAESVDGNDRRIISKALIDRAFVLAEMAEDAERGVINE
jgi:hypothetical protein